MGKRLTNNLGLKLISVFLAFFVWLVKLLLRVSLPAEAAGSGAQRASRPGGQTE